MSPEFVDEKSLEDFAAVGADQGRVLVNFHPVTET